jgi:hypothetical protein
MAKSPIKVTAYAAGERLQILELCSLHLIREKGIPRHRVADAVQDRLSKAGCLNLASWGRTHSQNTFPLHQILCHLEECGFVGTDGHLVVTPKGRTYMRQCSKRVRTAAAKIACDVLDRMAEELR